MNARGWLAASFAVAAAGGVLTAMAARLPARTARGGEPSDDPERPRTHGAPAMPYMRGLDGLRALGVLAVLLYHADVGWMSCGFLGVELFFVVSGFLITTILLAEMREQGRLDVRRFWLRRARRLLPAAFALIVATLVVTLLFLPEEVAALRGDALAGFGYVSNWFLIIDDQSYFESLGRPSLLRHLWSLAVEEQFYIIWPLVMVLLLGRMRRWRAISLIVIAAIASTALMAHLYDPTADPSRIYYGTDTRAAGLLIGAALAFLWESGWIRGHVVRAPGAVVDLAGIAALGAIAYAFWRIGEFDSRLYQGGFAVFGLLSALLIAVAVHPKSRLSAWVLGRQPLRWIGLRSYSIYLWHWPVFMLTRPQLDVQFDGIELLALRFAIVFVLAELSYRLIETPFRSGAVGRFFGWLLRPRGASIRAVTYQWIAPASAACVLILTLGLSVASAEPPEPPPYLAAGRVETRSWSVLDYQPPPLAPGTPQATATPAPPTATVAPSPTASPAPATPSPAAATAAPTLAPLATAPPTLVPTPAATPTPPPVVPPPPGRVFALGDSVMLGAASSLPSYLGDVEIDAEVGRQAGAALEILKWRKQNGLLGDVVVLHIGNNGMFTSAQLNEALQLLSDVPEVAVVNVKVPRAWEGANNEAIAQVVPNYPNAVVVDWHGASASYPSIFYSDGIHLQPEGATYYAQVIAAALNQS